MEQGIKMDLLDYLASKSGCAYLSDLHCKMNLLLIQHEITRIDPKQFSLDEWNEAAAYISQEEISFDTSSQAKEYLLSIKE